VPKKRQEKPPEPEKILFNEIKNSWMKWWAKKNGGTPPKFEAKEAAAVSKLRAYFLRVAKLRENVEPYQEAAKLFNWVLENWECLKKNNFLYAAVDISMINSKINEIINFINHDKKNRRNNSGTESGFVYDNL
jgi:hypothetical protein